MNETEKASKTLLFCDKTKLEESHAFENGNNLFIYVYDASTNMKDLFSLLIDPTNTKQIIYQYAGSKIVFDGYTKLTSINDYGSNFTATLTKEKDGGE